MNYSEWNVYTVNELIELGMLDKPLDGNHGTIHPKSKDYVDFGVPFIMANDLKNGKIDYRTCKYITDNQAKTLKKGFAKPGDVLLTHKATMGRTAIVDNSFPYVVLTPQVTYYRVLKGISNKYLKYYFDSSKFQEILKNWSGSGSTRSYLGIIGQLKLPVRLPDLQEQKAIADTLSCLDDKIELNNRINKKLEEMAQAIFKSWFVDFEPFQDGEFEDSELGRIPQGWRVGAIGDYTKVKSGYAFKSSWWESDGIPVIKIKEIENGTINFNGVSYVSDDKASLATEFKVYGGELLIAMTGATIGKFSIVPKLNSYALVNQRVGKFLLGENPIQKLGFIYCYLKIDEINNEIVSRGDGSAQPNISPSGIETIKIVLPSVDIIEKFNKLVEKKFKMMIYNLEQNSKLIQIRHTLLPKLMSGEIRVPIEEEAGNEC